MRTFYKRLGKRREQHAELLVGLVEPVYTKDLCGIGRHFPLVLPSASDSASLFFRL